MVLYGSAARGEARRDSDVDLLLVVRGLPRGAFKRQELFIEVEDSFRVDIEEAEKLGYHVDFSPILKKPEEAERIFPSTWTWRRTLSYSSTRTVFFEVA